MKLLLFRHGIAENHSPDGSDEARRLTDEGVEKTRQVARGLARLIDAPDAIFTSPKVRARQTAQIVGDALGVQPVVWPVLAEGPAHAAAAALHRRKENTLILVGHEPTLSEMVQLLLSGRRGSCIDMKKAGCACVEFDPHADSGGVGTGTLLWLATPKMLAAIAGD